MTEQKESKMWLEGHGNALNKVLKLIDELKSDWNKNRNKVLEELKSKVKDLK